MKTFRQDQSVAGQEPTRGNDFEKFFDSQITTLKIEVPEQIVEILQNQKGPVLKKASEMAPPAGGRDGNIPFLPVVPLSWRGPYDQMSMVRIVDRKRGCSSSLNPTLISDVVEAPRLPYYAYDVENGGCNGCYDSLEKAERFFQQRKRSPLTVAETIALAAYTDVLSRHNVWALGSYYGADKLMLGISLAYGSLPILHWCCFDALLRDTWRYPSCGSRGQ